MRFHLASFVSSLGLLAVVGCTQGGSVSSEHVQAAPESTAMPAPVAPAKAPADAIELALVVDVAGEPQVVLGNESEDAWAVGEPTLVERDALYIARRDVDLAAMSATSKSQLGRAVNLYDDRGLRCEAVVSDLSLIVRADPRMDTRDEWDGKGYSGKTTKATPSEIATDVWAMNAPVMVAKVRPVKGTCAGATFARSALLGAPVVAEATRPDPATKARIVAFARTTPAYASIQTEFAAEPKIPGEPPRPTRWEDMPYTDQQVVTMRAGTTSYAWVTIATEGGCGDFNARYGALLREDPTAPGGFVIVDAPAGGVDQLPRTLVDFGDGAPTMLFTDSVLRPDAGAYRYETQVVYSQECPC